MAWSRIHRADILVGYEGGKLQVVYRADLKAAYWAEPLQVIRRGHLLVAYRDPLPDDDPDDPIGPPSNAKLVTAGFARINSSAHRGGGASYVTAGMTAWNS